MTTPIPVNVTPDVPMSKPDAPKPTPTPRPTRWLPMFWEDESQWTGNYGWCCGSATDDRATAEREYRRRIVAYGATRMDLVEIPGEQP